MPVGPQLISPSREYNDWPTTFSFQSRLLLSILCVLFCFRYFRGSKISYDNAKVTIGLRRTSNLQEHPTKGARLCLGTIHLQSCKIIRDSVRELAYGICKRNFSTF